MLRRDPRRIATLQLSPEISGESLERRYWGFCYGECSEGSWPSSHSQRHRAVYAFSAAALFSHSVTLLLLFAEGQHPQIQVPTYATKDDLSFVMSPVERVIRDDRTGSYSNRTAVPCRFRNRTLGSEEPVLGGSVSPNRRYRRFDSGCHCSAG
jgi:hypothetical protein